MIYLFLAAKKTEQPRPKEKQIDKAVAQFSERGFNITLQLIPKGHTIEVSGTGTSPLGNFLLIAYKHGQMGLQCDDLVISPGGPM